MWTAFVRKLTRRGLRGVKLVVSDSAQYRREGDIDPLGRMARGMKPTAKTTTLAREVGTTIRID